MYIGGIVYPSRIRSTGGKWQLCLNILVALPLKPLRLDWKLPYFSSIWDLVKVCKPKFWTRSTHLSIFYLGCQSALLHHLTEIYWQQDQLRQVFWTVQGGSVLVKIDCNVFDQKTPSDQGICSPKSFFLPFFMLFMNKETGKT